MRSRHAVVGLLLMVAASGCVPLPAPSTSPLATATKEAALAADQATPTEDRWNTLLRLTPYPYTAPLPPSAPSPLDGTYVKTDLSEGEHVHCLRCPDYLPEAGLWKLHLDRGVFRIYYQGTGWRSLGSFTVEGEEVQFFNDPNCPDETGTYRWWMADGEVAFGVIEDTCSTDLRAANLTKQPWLSCRPPNREAMITDHWPKPPGCD